MVTTRRTFIRIAAASGGALGLGLVPHLDVIAAGGPAGRATRRRVNLHILILGGTEGLLR